MVIQEGQFKSFFIKNHLLNVGKEYSCTPFSIDQGEIHRIYKSNLFPFSMPSECFQFNVKFAKEEKPWKICNDISSNNEITAVPFKGMIYAFGTKDELSRLFSDWIKSDISRTPISRKSLIDIHPLKDLVLKTLTKAISSKAGVYSNFKNKAWDILESSNITVNNNTYKVFRALKLFLFFDDKYNYVSFVPSFKLETDEDLDKETVKEISRLFHQQLYQRKPNLNFANYIHRWINKIFKKDGHFRFEYPPNSGSGFYFVQSNANACIGIHQTMNRTFRAYEK